METDIHDTCRPTTLLRYHKSTRSPAACRAVGKVEILIIFATRPAFSRYNYMLQWSDTQTDANVLPGDMTDLSRKTAMAEE